MRGGGDVAQFGQEPADGFHHVRSDFAGPYLGGSVNQHEADGRQTPLQGSHRDAGTASYLLE